MRIHLIAPPYTQTTRDFFLDGFTQCTIRFAHVLKNLGHTVFIYGSEHTDAPCAELITCITSEEQATFLGTTPYQYAATEAHWPLWALANQRTIVAIAERKQPRDLICSIGGTTQQSIAQAHPDLQFVEYSIGYQGSFSAYRVFESHAWRHVTYGAQGITDGRFFDDVIPMFFDPDDFPIVADKLPYALYVGRLTPRKGIGIACQAAALAGIQLKVLGHGDPSLVIDGADWLGSDLPPAARNQLLACAKVVLCPTLYVEPFCAVAVEAQLCGTPVVSTDFGGFTETVEHGKTGFRCAYLGEFVAGIHAAPTLDPLYIRARAERLYSLAAVGPSYQQYFDRLSLLWDKGWDTMHADIGGASHASGLR